MNRGVWDCLVHFQHTILTDQLYYLWRNRRNIDREKLKYRCMFFNGTSCQITSHVCGFFSASFPPLIHNRQIEQFQSTLEGLSPTLVMLPTTSRLFS